MIFDLTKNYVPESYRDSRDYRVFLRQLGILTSVFKYNIDNFTDLYNPDEIPDHMLPLLATMVGYDYSEDKSVSSSREIVKEFPLLIRNRGSDVGIKNAVILSLRTDSKTSDNKFSSTDVYVEKDYKKGLIKIYYPEVGVDVKDIDWSLIDVVRPVGMRLEFIPSDFAFMSEEVDIKASARISRHHSYFDKSVVDKSQVGFDKVNKNESGDSN